MILTILTGYVVLNPFFLVLGWMIIEFGFLLNLIWQPKNQVDTAEIIKFVPSRTLFSGIFTTIFGVSVLYFGFLVIFTQSLHSGIFREFRFTIVILMIVGILYIFWTFLSHLNWLYLGFFVGLIGFLLLIYLLLIPRSNQYLSVLWVYAPLICSGLDIVMRIRNDHLAKFEKYDIKLNWKNFPISLEKLFTLFHISSFIIGLILLRFVYRGIAL